jgi:hypothetical protein
MIAPLRKTHLMAASVMAALLPVLIVAAVRAWPSQPESLDRVGADNEVVWASDAAWQKHAIVTRLVRTPRGSLAINFTAQEHIAAPDLVVYLRRSDSLEDAILLGEFRQTLKVPAHAGNRLELALYSAADARIVDIATIEVPR